MVIFLIKNTILYTSSSIVSSLAPFLLIPILTRFLSAFEYGELAMFTLFISGMTAVIGLSMHGAIYRFYFENESKEERSKFIGNCAVIFIASTTVFTIITMIFESILASILGLEISWLYIAIVIVSFVFFINVRLVIWQAKSSATSYAFMQILQALLNFIISYVLIVILSQGGIGRIYGFLFSSILIGMWALLSIIRSEKIDFSFDYKYMKYALDFCIPLIPHTVGTIALLSLDRLLIKEFMSLDMVGVYMVAISFGTAVNVLLASANKAYCVVVFSKLKLMSKDINITLVRQTYMFIFVLIILGSINFVISPYIVRFIVGDEYYDAADLVPLIISGQMMVGMYIILSNYIYYDKKTKYISISTVMSGVVNFLLSLLLIPKFGLMGAAWSFFFANICLVCSTFWFCVKTGSMPWFEVRRFSNG